MLHYYLPTIWLADWLVMIATEPLLLQPICFTLFWFEYGGLWFGISTIRWTDVDNIFYIIYL